MKNRFQILLAPDDSAGGAAGGSGGGSGVSPEELTKAIEKARLEERKKLTDQITTLTTQVASLTEQIAALTAEKTKLDTDFGALKTAHEALKAGTKADGGVDVEKAIQAAVTAALSKQGPALQQEIQTLRGELEQERQLRQAAELERTRARIIEEAGGPSVLIAELVTGTTEEELKASAANSKGILERAVANAKGSSSGGSSTASGTGNSGLRTVPIGAAGTSTGAGGKTTVVPGGRIPLSEYAANRAKLKADALARAKGA